MAAKWEIPITVTKEKLYSIDENLWGTGHRVRRHRGSLGARRPTTCTP